MSSSASSITTTSNTCVTPPVGIGSAGMLIRSMKRMAKPRSSKARSNPRMVLSPGFSSHSSSSVLNARGVNWGSPPWCQPFPAPFLSRSQPALGSLAVMASTTLLLGTRKGLWILSSDERREAWSVDGPHFLGHIVQHAVLDPRDGRTILLAMRTGHLGPTVFRSTDLGGTWHEATTPPAFASGDPLERSLNAVFWLTPGHADEPGSWYAG